jgi:hypothetical protein
MNDYDVNFITDDIADEHEINFITCDILDEIITYIESQEDYLVNNTMYKKQKYVTFNNIQRVHHIINREYIQEENLKSHLWWSGADFVQFRNEAGFELAMFMQINPTANQHKYAKALWYELDFDTIYQHVIFHGIIPIELIKIKN